MIRKHDQLWNDINTLLTYLRYEVHGMDVPGLVGASYARYRNPAPELLMRSQIAKLQKALDEAP